VRAVVATGDDWEIAIEEFETGRAAPHRRAEFAAVVEQRATEFEGYRASLVPTAADGDPATAARAAYVLWSATVQPGGFLRRESILMSKHWMDKVWSWDHCFNALAVAPHDADLALDQLLTPFDHQDDTGALPDSVTHSEVLYNYVKPPIHGWAFAKLRERINRPLSQDALVTVHRKLSRWTRFWLDHRRAPGHALPFYQHGNDSGWDNSTMFDLDRVVEAPDLAAFLVIQLEVLADLTAELGLGDGETWRRERDRVLDALVTQLWDGESFFAQSPTTGRRSTTSSLLVTLPIVLGARLPEAIRTALGARIEQHLTEWGLATQLPGTGEYEDDGYWRGPIWAPSTALIEDGLRGAGFTELADRVSERFLALCERSGFAENFDAVTGDGLRDRAYTWTASVYLLLADAARR
jgi:glycogen debranching enzyme